MLDYGFSQVETVVFDNKDYVVLPMVGGYVNEVTAFVKDKISFTLPKGNKSKIEKVVEVPTFLYAPLKQGQVIGKVKYKLNDQILAYNDLVVSKNEDIVKQNKNWWQKFCGFFVDFFN